MKRNYSNPVILFLGDSITYGYQVASHYSFPAIIENHFRKSGFSKMIMINAGNPGDTIQMAHRRLIDYLERYSHIKIIVIFLGANDFLLGNPPEDCLEDYIQLIRKIKAYNQKTTIMIVEVKPFSFLNPNRKEKYKNIFKTLKKIFPDIILIPDVLQEIIQNPGYTLSDGIHPNEKGYEQIAQKLYPYLKKEIEKQ